MLQHHTVATISRKRSKKEGRGLINTLIDKLPFELHIPGYNFCGPGTKLKKRLSKGDVGVNSLDEACKEHDLAYSQTSDLSKRHLADSKLATKAWERVKSKNSSLGEKLSGITIAGIMKTKRKLGMGLRNKRGGALRRRKKRTIKTPTKIGGNIRTRKRRLVQSCKKIGGFLPLLLPILGALGALGGGAAGIAKAVNDIKVSKGQLEELHRHNKALEDVSKGKGLFIKPYKSGRGIKRGKGLFIKPYKGGGFKKKRRFFRRKLK